MYYAQQITSLQALRLSLWGKSHYFDADTCRFFRSRVSGYLPASDTVITVRESIPRDHRDDSHRAYRVAIVDLVSGRIWRVGATKATIGKAQARVVAALRHGGLGEYDIGEWQDRVIRGTDTASGATRDTLEREWGHSTGEIIDRVVASLEAK